MVNHADACFCPYTEGQESKDYNTSTPKLIIYTTTPSNYVGGPTTKVMPEGPSVSFTGPPAQVGPGIAKIRGLKIEMPEKYFGSQVPIFHGWHNKMERYFQLTNCPAGI